jgi:nanoRNase/pAp phosphatase (c-di-AMP/oligoRNAs hydrolase)
MTATTAFVESCVETVADSAVAVERRSRGRPRAKMLLELLADKKNILVTTHQHPDPDALASGLALCHLLAAKLKGAKVGMSIKGRIGGGINEMFVRLSNLKLLPWDDEKLGEFDAIILLDTQPMFAFSPLPAGVVPMAVIDHHRGKSRKSLSECEFCDVRTDVGATSSIVFSYFMELEVPIKGDLAATLLYAIETDLAGAAGTPGELDQIALSSLTLLADPRKLYQMRYVSLPQGYYLAYANGLANAHYWENGNSNGHGAVLSHLETIDSMEQPAVIADFLLRFDKAQWAMVTAVHESKLVLSIRTNNPSKLSAADMAKKVLRQMGEGGGHRTKAGGFIKLETGSVAEVDRLREMLKRRYLSTLGIKGQRGQKLVPHKTNGN